jgi:hypothetical protein
MADLEGLASQYMSAEDEAERKQLTSKAAEGVANAISGSQVEIAC